MIGARLIGLAVNSAGLRTVALKKFRRRLQVIGWEERPWTTDCLKTGFGECNVLDEEGFSADVGAALKPLKAGKAPIALSLSDRSGATLITTLGEPLKRGREGIELLKWHLREQFPGDPGQLRLAYQVIGSDPEGNTRLLVAAARHEVLEQYERLLAEAGAPPATVLFESLSLLHYYHGRGIVSGNQLLVSLSPDSLALQLVGDGTLLACRNRPAPADPKTLYREVSRTLADWERRWPHFTGLPAYLFATPHADDWRQPLEDALNRPLQSLGEQPLPLAAQLEKGPFPIAEFCSAVGAAEHLGRFCW